MKEINLTKGIVALVDDDDFEWLNQFNWFPNKSYGGKFRAVRNGRDENGNHLQIKMHRMILGVIDPKIKVDHKDHNPLNNQRSNLRICSNTQNCYNSSSAKNSTSTYLGVSIQICRKNKFRRRTNDLVTYESKPKWRTTITHNRKQIHLGRFDDEKEAAIAYNSKALELFGEFANLNIIPS